MRIRGILSRTSLREEATKSRKFKGNDLPPAQEAPLKITRGKYARRVRYFIAHYVVLCTIGGLAVAVGELGAKMVVANSGKQDDVARIFEVLNSLWAHRPNI